MSNIVKIIDFKRKNIQKILKTSNLEDSVPSLNFIKLSRDLIFKLRVISLISLIFNIFLLYLVCFK